MYTRIFSVGLCLGIVGLGLMGCKEPQMQPGPHAVLASFSPYQAYTRQREYWPTAGWKTKTLTEVGIDDKRFQRVVDYLFTRTGNDHDRKGIRTDGLVLIKNGHLVFEKYARGFDKDKPHLSWSVSKSFVNALYGIAMRQKLYTLDQSASLYYPALQRTPQHKQITIRHLLHMSSGLQWFEGYEANILNSSVISMLYASGRTDMARFATTFPVKYTPGTHMYYSSGTTNLAVGVLRGILKGKNLETFIWNELFAPIGMKKVTWQRDGADNIVGSSYLYAPPRQLAKFGYLFLNDGTWEGKRILPASWVKFSTSVAPADPKGIYGAHWWLNAGRPKQNVTRRFPEAPADTFMASGHWGQAIVVIPSLDLVAVLTSDNRDGSMKMRRFLKLLTEAVQGKNLFAKTPTKRAAPAPTPRPQVQPAVQNAPTPPRKQDTNQPTGAHQ